ncbi:hypothetical protein PoB_003260100 [Plakobranchus ocellatus]|uniref:Uncharacterized protein n=1 Tax=Plakobranchus ocellatus TaxID=259542 RepID=A0AAV4ACJ9_9GAST|nr:hypothetical protein PoB_003260100 [Plakobranchus ocellatus]
MDDSLQETDALLVDFMDPAQASYSEMSGHWTEAFETICSPRFMAIHDDEEEEKEEDKDENEICITLDRIE